MDKNRRPKKRSQKRPKRHPQSGIRPRRRLFVVVAGILVVAAVSAYIVFGPPKTQEPLYFVQFESRLAEADLAGFYSDCVRTVLERDDVPATCRDAAVIDRTYNLDPVVLLNIQLSKISTTARRIASGDLISMDEYEDCLARGECAKVPLIPPELRDKEAVRQSPQAQKIAALFSHFANRGTLTAEACAFMEECRALLKIGIITPADLRAPPEPAGTE